MTGMICRLRKIYLIVSTRLNAVLRNRRPYLVLSVGIYRLGLIYRNCRGASLNQTCTQQWVHMSLRYRSMCAPVKPRVPAESKCSINASLFHMCVCFLHTYVSLFYICVSILYTPLFYVCNMHLCSIYASLFYICVSNLYMCLLFICVGIYSTYVSLFYVCVCFL